MLIHLLKAGILPAHRHDRGKVSKCVSVVVLRGGFVLLCV